MQKRTLIFSVVLFLGICYLWPWAIRRKTQQMAVIALEKKRPENMAVSSDQLENASAEPDQNTPVQEAVQLIFPVKGKGLSHIISYFGDPRAGGKRKHEGVDIAAPRGTPVLAVADGTIDKVKEGGSGGKQIWLVLENGWKIYYAHLHTQLVKPGQKVKTGELIGTVGNTGNAVNAGPHLHFCLYPTEKKPLNPLLYLPGQLSIP